MCDPLAMLGVPSGPSSSEQSLAGQESSLSSSLQADFAQRYGQQSQTMAQLNSVINRIQAGDTGPGFGAAEEAARTSDIVNQGAAAARNTEQATRNIGAGQTFGSNATGQTSAINKQIGERAASSASANTANALIKNTAENFQQGRINAAQTAGGLESLSGIENPLAYAQDASSTNSAAFDQAGKIRQLQDAHAAGIGNLIKAGVEDVVMPGISGAMGAGGGFFDSLKGFIGGATNTDLLGGGGSPPAGGDPGAPGYENW